MPMDSEKVVNRALSGTELKQLILEDCRKLVDNEGILAAHIAFGRVSYTLHLTIHTGNVYYPESTIKVEGGQPDEKLPLVDPPVDASLGQTTLHRNIISPNAERVRVGMPIPVETRQQDGTRQIEMIHYPPQPELGEGDVSITDTTSQAKAQLNIKEQV
jgi:hypothetical protein